MAKNLVIVESPAKAKTLKKFLGTNYKIEASVGHVRDLPKSDLGVDIENDYEPRYITIRGKGEVLAKLRKEAKLATKVFLATDPDREGEAISWHLLAALKLPPDKVYRITFNQITKDAVKSAIKDARNIDMKLVDAQQARRVLDRVVGYKMSPLLWTKVRKRLSAGRVQSVALKLICDREEDVNAFIPEEYWSLNALLTHKKKTFDFKFHSLNGEKLPFNNEQEIDTHIDEIKKHEFIVTKIKNSTRIKKPNAPFSTSTLQQEASKNLDFPTNKTMSVAQQLYEGVDIEGAGTVGLLTYIRTDSTRIAPEAFLELQGFITSTYGDKFTPSVMREYKNKSRAQDAHEAIRPTFVTYKPDDIKGSLSKDQYKLYKLVWSRFVASQMPDAVYETSAIDISASNYIFRGTSSKLSFLGHLAVHDVDKETDTNPLPTLELEEKLTLKDLIKNQHFTQPPPRFSDASLVKTLEELGIGRPSTYSAIVTTLLFRNYILKENKTFYPTELGGIVNDILAENFCEIVNVDFTAKMESELDQVEEGNLPWKEVLRQFYPDFEKQIENAFQNIGEIVIEDEKTDVICEKCGTNMVIKYGRYGKFLACPSFPNCRNAKPFLEEAGVKCPLCEGEVVIKKSKKGRKYFGCDHAECEFISWNKPNGNPCPKCDGFLVEKGSKKIKVTCEKCNYLKEE